MAVKKKKQPEETSNEVMVVEQKHSNPRCRHPKHGLQLR